MPLPTSRPNILLIMTDQERHHGWLDDLSIFPNRYRLYQKSVRFERFYTNSSLCTPARGVLFTGKHAPVNGMVDNINFPHQPSLSEKTPTIGNVMTEHGYAVAYKGKWHLARNKDITDGLRPWGFHDWEGPDHFGTAHEGKKHDGYTAHAAAQWINNYKSEKPWMLVVSFINPHDIMWAPRWVDKPSYNKQIALPQNVQSTDDLTTKPFVQKRLRQFGHLVGGYVSPSDIQQWEYYLRQYIDLHAMVDEHIGTVLNALESSVHQSSTVVIFTSDHGELAGSHGLRGKGPVVYEENSRIPFWISAPDWLEPGSVTSTLGCTVDIFPTVCGLTKTPLPSEYLPGKDLTPALANREKVVRDKVLLTYDGQLYVGPFRNPIARSIRAMVHHNDKFARYFPAHQSSYSVTDQLYEHYDLANDSAELNNLARDAPKSTDFARLYTELRELENLELR